MTRKRLLAIVMVSMLVAGVPVAAAACSLSGWYYGSAIDSNQNGQADLSVCFDITTVGAIYVNKDQVEQEMERWHGASVGGFSQNGICNSDGSNIRILRRDLGYCEASDHDVIPMTLGFTDHPGNTGYSAVTFYLNSQCIDDFDWYDTDGIDANKWSALAVALHETGHALGLKHSSVANAVMNIHGPDNCDMFEHDLGLAFDDADGYRDRYLAIFDTVTSFNASAACFN